jgi:hypothetical protein
MAANTTVRVPLTDATLTINGTTCKTVENVTLKLVYDKPEVNTRNSRVKQKLPTLLDVGLEFNMPGDTADTCLSALKTACLTPSAIQVTCTDGVLSFGGQCGVESLDNDQPLAGVSGYKFGLFPWAVGVNGTPPSLS